MPLPRATFETMALNHRKLLVETSKANNIAPTPRDHQDGVGGRVRRRTSAVEFDYVSLFVLLNVDAT